MLAEIAVVVVTCCFLAFLRNEGQKSDRRAANALSYLDDLTKLVFDHDRRLIAELRDALADQRRSFRDELRHQIEMTDAMGRDCLVVLKALTERLDEPQATATPPGIERAVGGLDAKRDPRARPTQFNGKNVA